MNTKLILIGTCMYGAARNLMYAPRIREDEYVTDRIVKFAVLTIASPILTPTYLLHDLKNLEHTIRGMPGPIDRSPW
jgi:hypothetical protein